MKKIFTLAASAALLAGLMSTAFADIVVTGNAHYMKGKYKGEVVHVSLFHNDPRDNKIESLINVTIANDTGFIDISFSGTDVAYGNALFATIGQPVEVYSHPENPTVIKSILIGTVPPAKK